MNKVLTLACLLFFLNAANLKAQNLNIIPLPESIEMGEGHLVLKEGSVIAAKTEIVDNPELGKRWQAEFEKRKAEARAIEDMLGS